MHKYVFYRHYLEFMYLVFDYAKLSVRHVADKLM